MDVKATIRILSLVAGFFIFSNAAFAAPEDIIINEVLYDPLGTDTGLEFIELYNRGAEAVELTGWEVDPSSAPYVTFPAVTLEPKHYLVIHVNASGTNTATDVYSGALSNMSNTKGPVALFASATHSEETLVSYLAYGEGGQANESKAVARGLWNAGDFIPLVTQGTSISYDGSGNTSGDWYSGSPTPGSPNKPFDGMPEDGSESTETDGASPTTQNYTAIYGAGAGDILINEFVADPADEEDEWIELFNMTNRLVELSDLALTDGSGKRTELTGTMTGLSFLVVTKPKGVLNNAGDVITLISDAGEVIYEVTYGDWGGGVGNAPTTHDPNAVARGSDGTFYVTTHPTPGGGNIIEKPDGEAPLSIPTQKAEPVAMVKKESLLGSNGKPIALFDADEIILLGSPLSLDASRSYDPDNDPLTYLWEFGNGDGLAGMKTSYRYLKVGEYTLSLTVSDGTHTSREEKMVRIVADATEVPLSEEEIILQKKIYISEFLPNPEGDDGEGEWIEIFNSARQSVDLSGWTLDDGEGGSKPYSIPSGTMIDEESYVLFTREDTKLSLNNTNDKVRLFAPNKSLVDSIAYSKVLEGKSYARLNGRWTWTEPTSEEPNVETLKASSKAGGAQDGFRTVSLKDLHELPLNTGVAVQGIVTLPPKTAAKTYLYIGGESEERETQVGIQVQLRSGAWPELATGDRIEVRGVVTESTGERRIRASSVVKLDGGNALSPHLITVSEITDDVIGSLVKVSGTIVELKSSTAYLNDDSGEIRVYLHAGIPDARESLAEGETYEVTGVVSKTAAGLRIIPENMDSFHKVEVAGIGVADEKKGGAQNEVVRYLIVTLMALTAITLGLTWQIRRKKKELGNIKLPME